MESTEDHDTALLWNLPQDPWSSAPCVPFQPTSCTPLHTLFVPTTWNFLQSPECSLSSQTSRHFHIAFLLSESLCPHVFSWRIQVFVKNLKGTSTSLANSPGKLLTSFYSHSALFIPLSQHLVYYTPITGSQAYLLQ